MTDRQKLFVEEYLKDYNATKAAIRAGYSKRTAYSQGQRLLKNVEIKQAIADFREKIKNDNIVDIKDIEEFLSQTMLGNIQEEVIYHQDGKMVRVKRDPLIRDRVRAAELMGRRYALFTDGIKMDTDFKIEIVKADED